jgi:hypothetical protein
VYVGSARMSADTNRASFPKWLGVVFACVTAAGLVVSITLYLTTSSFPFWRELLDGSWAGPAETVTFETPLELSGNRLLSGPVRSVA